MNNRKVFVVTSGSYSDYGIDAMFSTKELAKKYCKSNDHLGLNGVDEWELDVKAGEIRRRSWQHTLHINKNSRHVKYGQIDERNYDFYEQALPTERSRIDADQYWVQVTSFVSKEHSHKLAVEQWQKHLAKEDFK